MGKATTNCINCGAVLEETLESCPYCGTSYYDLTFMDIDSGKPFVMKIRTNLGGKTVIVSQLVRARHDMRLTETSEDISLNVGLGNRCLHKEMVSRSLSTSISFDAVVRNDGSLCKIEIQE